MDTNRHKSNWRRIQERTQAASELEEKKAILRDAIAAIEDKDGRCASELIYPYEKLIDLLHQSKEHEAVQLLLPRYYLVMEINFAEEPERLLQVVEKMRDYGHLPEAMSACCRLLYLLYESYAVKKRFIEDVWYLLSAMHKERPDVNAKKLLKYMPRKIDGTEDCA